MESITEQPITTKKGTFPASTVIISDLPGCMTQGETLEEVVANIEDSRY